MPRRMDELIRKAVIRAAINDREIGAPRMRRDAKALIDKGKLPGPLPSERAIGDVMKKARSLPTEQQRPYKEVFWPETFRDGVLPYEASRAFVELSRAFGSRPLVSTTEWYWRISLAIPESDAETRWFLAVAAADADAEVSPPERWRAVEERMLSGIVEGTVVRKGSFKSEGELYDWIARMHGTDMAKGVVASWQSHEQPTKEASISGSRTGAGARRSRSGKRASATGASTTPTPRKRR